jgi:uncharacterized protein (DUF1499 family)
VKAAAEGERPQQVELGSDFPDGKNWRDAKEMVMEKRLVALCCLFLLAFLPACGTRAGAGDRTEGMAPLPPRLAPCPSSPNCVCSEDKDSRAWVQPLAFSGDPGFAWEKAGLIVQELGGRVDREGDNFLQAVFTSLIFRFKDDLELRLDHEAKVIHIRSASRIGYSDFGVNRRRVERIRARFSEEVR